MIFIEKGDFWWFFTEFGDFHQKQLFWSKTTLLTPKTHYLVTLNYNVNGLSKAIVYINALVRYTGKHLKTPKTTPKPPKMTKNTVLEVLGYIFDC
jgi:hypothetical protein